MSELFDLTGKVAVITGGSGGIGSTLAVGLAKHGADVVVTSRTLDKLEPVADKVRALGKKAMAISSDVTDEKSVAKMVEAVVNEFSKIDILVNSAGITIRYTALEFPADAWRKIIDFNVAGTFLCIQAVGKIMIEQGGGKIINMSSVRSGRGAPGAAAYGPSKGAIDAMTRNLACEWARQKVYINAIAPSLILTELTKSLLTPEKTAQVTSTIPLGRMALLEDIVGPTVFLASDASNFITGEVIHLDGGMSAGIP